MVARLALIPLLLLSASAAAGGPTAERQRELIYRLRQDCGSCHGMTLKGGLGPALLPARMRQRDESHLAEVIRDGIPGTPMPPWGFEISEAEARWLARQLRQGVADGR
jgi:cytochrome c55X